VLGETEKNDQGKARNGEACECGKAQGLVGTDFVAGARKCYVTSSQMTRPRKGALTLGGLQVEGRMAAQGGEAAISWRRLV